MSSRGMGAMSPSKMPKARTIKKKDGNEPVEVFEEGGKVNEAGNYTKPGLRKRIFNSVKAAGKQFVAQPKSVARKTAGYR